MIYINLLWIAMGLAAYTLDTGYNKGKYPDHPDEGRKEKLRDCLAAIAAGPIGLVWILILNSEKFKKNPVRFGIKFW